MARKADPTYYDADGNVVVPKKPKKKGGLLKWIIMGLLLLLLFAGCSSLLSGGSKDSASGDSKASTSNSAGETNVAMGEEFAVGDWAVTIASIGEPSAAVGPDSFQAEAQGEFIPVTITAKNNAKEQRTFFADSIKLIGKDGSEFSYSTDAAMYGSQEGGMILEPTNPGNAAKGKLWFDVPAGTEIKEIKVAPGSFSMDKPVVVNAH